MRNRRAAFGIKNIVVINLHYSRVWVIGMHQLLRRISQFARHRNIKRKFRALGRHGHLKRHPRSAAHNPATLQHREAGIELIHHGNFFAEAFKSACLIARTRLRQAHRKQSQVHSAPDLLAAPEPAPKNPAAH